MPTFNKLWEVLDGWLEKKVYDSAKEDCPTYQSVLDKMRELERTGIQTKTVHFRSPRIKIKEESDG